MGKGNQFGMAVVIPVQYCEVWRLRVAVGHGDGKWSRGISQGLHFHRRFQATETISADETIPQGQGPIGLGKRRYRKCGNPAKTKFPVTRLSRSYTNIEDRTAKKSAPYFLLVSIYLAFCICAL
jgi:hypothetical protein